MNKMKWMTAIGTAGLALAGFSAPAAAGPDVSFGIYVGAPAYGVYVPPPVIYAPAPVVYYDPPPRVVYAPRAYYEEAPRYRHPGRHKGWNKHRHHHRH